MRNLWEDGPHVVSVGKTYKYRQLVAQPTELLFSKSGNRAILRLTPMGRDPRNISQLDVLVAELTALAVSRSYWRLRVTRAALDVYLAYPGPIQVAVDFEFCDVRQRVDTYLDQSGAALSPAVPASALAYCMLMPQSNILPAGEVRALQPERISTCDSKITSHTDEVDHYYRPALHQK